MIDVERTNDEGNSIPSDPVHRKDGVTDSERTLLRLCERTFLSLWSYAGVHHSENGPGGKLRGKELCDLLVVFDRHVLIFSDRSCAFPYSQDLDLDWQRWCRKSILGSARQLFGAERWLKEHPDRLYLDARCKQRFPLLLPRPGEAKYHRLVVARCSSIRCQKEMGGGGSLLVVPRIVGDDHLKPRLSGGLPFAVGQVNPRRGYVHVLDDNSLLLLLNTLNTVTDFVEYLTRKEQFVLSGRLEMAAGEEELLGYYYKDVGPDGFNDFVFPPEAEHIVLPEGHWDYFQKSPQRRAQLELDRISELWDAIIERFNRNALGGTLHYASGSGLSGHERAVRFMARERRTRRRMLAEGLAGLLSKTARDQRGVRMVAPSEPSDPLYVFLLIPKLPGQLEDEYREQRRNVLLMHALIAKLHFPEVEDIVGLATETGLDNGGRSEDLLYYDARGWTEEAEREARELQRQTGWLTNVERSEGTEYQFPPLEEAARRFPGPRISAKGKERNDKCPCGSGKKVKKCCGSKQR